MSNLNSYYKLVSQLSQHSLATSGIAISLRDGSINLTNAWTRQMSDTSIANVSFLYLRVLLQKCVPLFWYLISVEVIILFSYQFEDFLIKMMHFEIDS